MSHRARSLPIWSVYGPWGVKKIKIPSTNSMGHRVVSCNVFHNYFQSFLQLGKNHYCPLSVPLWSAAGSQTNRFGSFASSIHLNITIVKVPFATINVNKNTLKAGVFKTSIQVWHGLMFPLHGLFFLRFFNASFSQQYPNLVPSPRALASPVGQDIPNVYWQWRDFWYQHRAKEQ